MDFLFDIAQEGRIRAAQSSADRAAESAADQRSAIDQLRRRVEMLALASQALLEILRDRVGLNDAEVIQKMAEIDARDGALDGRIRPRVVACPQCHRKVSTARQRCLFCGNAVPGGHVFEKS